jgi:cupin 2 domain-containing protein
VSVDNLFHNLPDADDEVLDVLCHTNGVKIERIVSSGQSTPVGDWYDQETHEWVVLLEGRARLRFEDGDRIVEMTKGDHVFIAAHEKHRVEWTDPGVKSVWLAVHFGGDERKP